MSHVFISYSRRDEDYVAGLAEHLRRAGVAVFYDSSIGYSAKWWTSIVQSVDECSAMVVVMTPALDSSDWVMKEVLLGRRAGKPIFPLLLEGRGYPLLIDVQHLDVTSGALPGPDFVDALRAALGPGPGRTTPARTPVRSTETVGAPVSLRSPLDIDALAIVVERAHGTLEAWRKLDAVEALTPAMLTTRARALDDLGEVKQSLETCNDVLNIDAGHLDATLLKATQLSRLGYLVESSALLSDVLARHPRRVDALVVQAGTCRELALDGCEALVDRALALEPDNAWALSVKAGFLGDHGEHSAADLLLRRATALSPGSPEIVVNRVSNALRKKRFGEALEQVDALVQVFPRNPVYSFLRAVVRWAELMSETVRPHHREEVRLLADELISRGMEFGTPLARLAAGLGYLMLGRAFLDAGDARRADAEFARAEAVARGFPSFVSSIASLRATAGNR